MNEQDPATDIQADQADDDPERRVDSLIIELLCILGEEKRRGAEKKLRLAFKGDKLIPSKYPGVKTLKLPKLSGCMHSAIDHLKHQSAKKNTLGNPAYESFIRKVTRLRDLSCELADLLVDDEVQKFINYEAYRADQLQEISGYRVLEFYRDVFEKNSKLARDLSILIYDPYNTKGRPSLKALYEYVLRVGKLFQEVSTVPFSIYRHGESTEGSGKTYAQRYTF